MLVYFVLVYWCTGLYFVLGQLEYWINLSTGVLMYWIDLLLVYWISLTTSVYGLANVFVYLYSGWPGVPVYYSSLSLISLT